MVFQPSLTMAFSSLLFFCAIGTLLMILYRRGTLRCLYLVSKIRGPSVWELLWKAKKYLGEEQLTFAHTVSEKYSFKPWGLWTTNGYYVVFLSDPQTIHALFKSKNLCDKHELFYENDFIKGSLFIHDNMKKCKVHRKVMNPSFRKNILNANIHIVNEGAENIVELWRVHAGGSAFEMGDTVDEQLVETVLRFGTSDAIRFPNLRRFTSAIHQGLHLLHLKSVNPWLFWFRQKFQKSYQEAEKSIKSAIHEEFKPVVLKEYDHGVARMKDGPKRDPGDALEAVFYTISKLGAGSKFDRNDFFDEIETMLVAGAETSKTVIKIVLLVLSVHQEVQQRVYEEQERIFGRTDRRPTPEDVTEMEYLEMVIKESMRLFPPGPFLVRKADDETDLNGTIIPKGSVVAIFVYSLHRNPEAFEDPLRFDPDRFLAENSDKRHPYSYLPFSSGPRNCVGQVQGMMMVKIFVSYILRNFKVYPAEGVMSLEDIQCIVTMTLGLRRSEVKIVNRS